jgi:hypothetical protein
MPDPKTLDRCLAYLNRNGGALHEWCISWTTIERLLAALDKGEPK